MSLHESGAYALSESLSIRSVSHAAGAARYAAGMPDKPAWAIRLRQHMAEHDVSARQLSERLNMGSATAGHWLNGTREPGVADFLRLCEAAGADPAWVLLGRHQLPPAVREAAKVVADALQVDTATNERYAAFSKSMKKKR